MDVGSATSSAPPAAEKAATKAPIFGRSAWPSADRPPVEPRMARRGIDPASPRAFRRPNARIASRGEPSHSVKTIPPETRGYGHVRRQTVLSLAFSVPILFAGPAPTARGLRLRADDGLISTAARSTACRWRRWFSVTRRMDGGSRTSTGPRPRCADPGAV